MCDICYYYLISAAMLLKGEFSDFVLKSWQILAQLDLILLSKIVK